MRGPPVVLTPTLGRPVTNIISERGAVPMTVVNTLGEPVTLVAQGGEPVTLFNENGTLWDYPFSLFSNNEQGAWYDPSDYSTLYQDAAGTTPVTAVEQPVRLMLDRSKGLVLGPELMTNGGPSFVATTGWTGANSATVSIVGGNLRITRGATAGAQSAAIQYTGAVIGAWYAMTVAMTANSANINTTIQSYGNTTLASSATIDGSPTRTIYYAADRTNPFLFVRLETGSTGDYVDISLASVKLLPGNHATAPNDASRPVLRARYNLLTYTEQFDNAAWQKNDGSSVTANAVVAPDGTTTADQIDLSASELSRVQQPLSGQPTASYTFTVWLRVASGSVSVRFGHSADIDVITITDTWQRFTSTKTVTSPSQPNLTIRNEAGGGAKTLYAWGASVLTAADQSATGGAYQRIAAATDYDTSNAVWRPYLAFDGSDDSFGTSAIDFSGTDEMTVFAGVTRLSSTSTGILTELSTSVTTVNGSFAIVDRGLLDATTNGDYGVRSRGTTTVSVAGTTLTVPTTSVLTMLSDISAPSLSLAVNGAPYVSSTSTQGTGNFANAALFIGRRNNTSNPFNGRLYGLTVLGRTATAAELSAMEAWVAGKTGVTL